MRYRIATMTLGFAVAFLLATTLFIAGCGEGRLPVESEQENLLAPGNDKAKGKPHNDGNINGTSKANDKNKGKPHADVDGEDEPGVDGDTDGDTDDDTNDNPKGKGKGKAYGHLSVMTQEVVRNHRGAVKVPLLEPSEELETGEGTEGAEESQDLEAFGWIIARTTAGGSDDAEEGDVGAVDEAPDPSGSVLIITVHLDAGEGNEDFNIEVSVNDDVIDVDGILLTTNINGIGTVQIKIPEPEEEWEPGDPGSTDGDPELIPTILVKVTLTGVVSGVQYVGEAEVPLKE